MELLLGRDKTWNQINLWSKEVHKENTAGARDGGDGWRSSTLDMMVMEGLLDRELRHEDEAGQWRHRGKVSDGGMEDQLLGRV